MWFIVCQITFRVLEQFDLTDQYNVTAWLITAKIYSYPWPFERKRYTRKTSLKLYSHYLVCSFKTDQTEILKYFGTLYAALLHSVITQRLSRQYRKQKTYGFQYGYTGRGSVSKRSGNSKPTVSRAKLYLLLLLYTVYISTKTLDKFTK